MNDTLVVVLKTVPGSILIASIVFGNLLVIVAVATQTELRRTQNNWYVVSLAVADLLVGLIVMPLTLAFDAIGSWPFGDVLCDLWLALDVLFVTASILNLLVISLDRYWAVTRVDFVLRRARSVLFLTVLVWMFALAISLPPLIGWRREQSNSTCELSTEIAYVLYSAFGSFFGPLVVIIFIYFRIFQITRKRCQVRMSQLRRTTNSLSGVKKQTVAPSFGPHSPTDTVDVAETPLTTNVEEQSYAPTCTYSAQSSSKPVLAFFNAFAFSMLKNSKSTRSQTRSQKSSRSTSRKKSQEDTDLVNEQLAAMVKKQLQMKRQERRSMIVLGTILCVFILCWLPFFTLYVLRAVGVELQGRTGELAFTIIFWIGYCNSAVNPVVYAALNPQFKKAFQKILCPRSRRTRHTWRR